MKKIALSLLSVAILTSAVSAKAKIKAHKSAVVKTKKSTAKNPAAVATRPVSPTIPKPAPPSPVATSTDFAAELLAAHNAERAQTGARPLVWSAKLAADAKGWAERLAKLGDMQHANIEDAGENLWMGTHRQFSAEEMVGSWIEEKKDFKPGIFPNVSTTGNWLDVGHYTQLIWRNTDEVGCALASNARDDFLVCRYTPFGNVEGVRITNQK